MPVPLLYRRGVAIVSVLVFFTAASDYVFATGLTSAPPLYWILIMVALAVPLVWRADTLSLVIRSRLTWWCGFYAAMAVLAFTWSSQSEVAWSETRLRILASLFLVAHLIIFADAGVHRSTRIAVLWCVVLGVGFNVVDLIRPLTFSTTLGRSAGLYRNPNISAIALVLGMLVSMDLVPRAWRPWFVCFVGGGVFITFSRGGALTWIAATALVVAFRAMRLSSFVRVGVGLAGVAIGVIVLTGSWQVVLDAAAFASSDAWERLRVGTGTEEASALARVTDARLAWDMFVERPLLGWGVGATAEWDWFESTHNMYLRHLAEYGVVGAAIIPLLVKSLVRGMARPPVVWWLGGTVLIWSLFSHNLLDERHFLISIAFVACLPEGSPSAVEPAQPAGADLPVPGGRA